jgi:hypothetical protein
LHNLHGATMNREPHSGQESVSVATLCLGIAISPLKVSTLLARRYRLAV